MPASSGWMPPAGRNRRPARTRRRLWPGPARCSPGWRMPRPPCCPAAKTGTMPMLCCALLTSSIFSTPRPILPGRTSTFPASSGKAMIPTCRPSGAPGRETCPAGTCPARGAKLAELIYLHCLPLAAFPRARTVVSATPVVFGRHYKARQGAHRDWLEAELRRACAVQGLPEPVRVEPFPFLPIRDGAELPWSSFARQRKDKAPQPGYGFRLHFDSPVPVPFAIGSLAHFGLGLFVAGQENRHLLFLCPGHERGHHLPPEGRTYHGCRTCGAGDRMIQNMLGNSHGQS